MLTREHILLMIEEGNLEGAEKALKEYPGLDTPWIREMLRKARSRKTPSESEYSDGVNLFTRDKIIIFGYSVAAWASGGIGIRASFRN